MKTTAIILLVIAGLMFGGLGCTGIKQSELDAKDREIKALNDKLTEVSQKDESMTKAITVLDCNCWPRPNAKGLKELIGKAFGLAVEDMPDDDNKLSEYMVNISKMLQGQTPVTGTGSAISFALRVNPDNSPILPTADFIATDRRIYSCFGNQGVLKGLSKVITRWSNNETNEIITLETKTLNPDATYNFIWFEKKQGWVPGEYAVELFNTKTLALIAQGAFTVVPVEKKEEPKEDKRKDDKSSNDGKGKRLSDVAVAVQSIHIGTWMQYIADREKKVIICDDTSIKNQACARAFPVFYLAPDNYDKVICGMLEKALLLRGYEFIKGESVWDVSRIDEKLIGKLPQYAALDAIGKIPSGKNDIVVFIQPMYLDVSALAVELNKSKDDFRPDVFFMPYPKDNKLVITGPAYLVRDYCMSIMACDQKGVLFSSQNMPFTLQSKEPAAKIKYLYPVVFDPSVLKDWMDEFNDMGIKDVPTDEAKVTEYLIQFFKAASGKAEEKKEEMREDKSEESKKKIGQDNFPGLEFIVTATIRESECNLAFIVNTISHEERIYKEGDILDSEKYGRWIIFSIKENEVILRQYNKDGSVEKEHAISVTPKKNTPGDYNDIMINIHRAISVPGTGLPIFFTLRVNPDNSPVSPTTIFKSTDQRIYACFQNQGTLKGLTNVICRWTNKTTKEVMKLETKPIDSNAPYNFIWLEKREGWPVGEYAVELFNAKTWVHLAHGTFMVMFDEDVRDKVGPIKIKVGIKIYSPDKRFLLECSFNDKDEMFQLWLTLGSNAKKYLLFESPSDAFAVLWSPDSNKIILNVAAASGFIDPHMFKLDMDMRFTEDKELEDLVRAEITNRILDEYDLDHLFTTGVGWIDENIIIINAYYPDKVDSQYMVNLKTKVITKIK